MLNRNKRFKWYFLGGGLILLWGCSTTLGKIPELQSAGGKVYAEKCSSCHDLPHPKTHTYEVWLDYFQLLESYTKNKVIRTNLISTSEKTSILRYLKKHSKSLNLSGS